MTNSGEIASSLWIAKQLPNTKIIPVKTVLKFDTRIGSHWTVHSNHDLYKILTANLVTGFFSSGVISFSKGSFQALISGILQQAR